MKKRLFSYVLYLLSSALLFYSTSFIQHIPACRATFLAAGDVMLHDAVLADAKTPSGFDFAPMFEQIRGMVSLADLSFVNMEGVFAGEAAGYSGYPRFNAPFEAGTALAEAGFDIIGEANNHALDFGEAGVRSTVRFWDTLSDRVLMTGLYKKGADRIRIISRNGITFAVLSYTEMLNGLPAVKNDWVSVADRETMRSEVTTAKEKADCVIVFMHWGEEYSPDPSPAQRNIARFLASLGADVVVGSHPHVTQPVEWLTRSDGERTLVAYSLGNFLSCQQREETVHGGLLSLAFEKAQSGKVTINTPVILPVVTDCDSNLRHFRVRLLPVS